ncbi:MAG: hypothetical protein HZC22_18700 [Rhodocyclales bacterium]|nr:hypothetical protein [Rhodocyclales bacterium]
MIARRLELALERIQPSDWNRFERLASAFLAGDFDDIRTVASPGGDEGRDAELFSPSMEPNVLIQYSVTEGWRAKVNKTVNRLEKTFPNALLLIYVTNQVIGAEADDLKQQIRRKGLSLDVRDRHWFIERVAGSAQRQQAAEELATVVVDPYLSKAGVGPHVQSELSSPEAIAAATLLGLQWQDDVREKGLTKLAFEALVRAVLINTNADHRLPRGLVHSKVRELLPGHSPAQVDAFVDSALTRLEKHTVKRWQQQDEFHLAHEEAQRLNDYRVDAALAESNLASTIQDICVSQAATVNLDETSQTRFQTAVRAALDAVLFDRSQSFAMAVHTGKLIELADTDFAHILPAIITKSKLPKIQNVDWLRFIRNSIRQVLTSETTAVQTYLRSLSDTYTLLAFLKQTPDVQAAVEKMFSGGKLWLDASVVLPLLADTLADSDDERGRFSRMIEASRDSGLSIFVTPGVIEEVERHMNRALTCARCTNGKWEGSVPYLLERYVASGRSTASFSLWLENFRGDARPLQDIADYLRDELGINERSLESEAAKAPIELRHALQQIWHERYQRRKERYAAQIDEQAITRLVSHDIECYCGVVQLRTQDKATQFGYSAWWLTVDRQAFHLKERLRPLMTDTPPDSPVMSADFLVNYLAFGPTRRRVTKLKESHLPLLMVLSSTKHLTPEIMMEAERIRAELKDMPERVIRRQVRDHLDRAKSRIGPIASLGIEDDELLEVIVA